LGRIWVTMDPKKRQFRPNVEKFREYKDKVDIYYRKPKWYNMVYDPTNEVCGQLLMSYALIKSEDAPLIKYESIYPRHKK